ncbi:actin-interacting protein 1-like [Haliotis rufescens]|uniref:actin-interacting protein 1-like n=1 Tax=Haliotis rufescens TaxID=6454 RepID=UPI001EAFB6B9|nr:actin-interacting protein 1-like [Haliotis rufescens]
MSASLKSCFAALPRTERGRPIVMGKDPKGKNFLYCHGTNVYIRDIENPAIVDIYSEHARETTVAKYSPSGFYIASADITGKVRIWDTVNKTHILKNEFHVLGGKIKDLDWAPDNSKIVLVGAGKEKFGACITYDSGNNVGEISGHTKEANSCSYKPTRPFRIVTASEDQTVVFLEGPPFKYTKTIGVHTNFVNCVRFSPTGDVFITGGADARAYVFDGKTGEQIGELGAPAHGGGIYALDFSPDGSQVLTVSGDKTAKIWDVPSRQLVTEFRMGTEVRDMQVGCLWQGSHILTVSLSGHINYLDKDNPTTPLRIIKGHNKPITALAVTTDRSRIYTGTSEAAINYWNVSSGESEEMKGKGHSSQVQDMSMDEDTFTTVGFDDTLRDTSAISNEYSLNSNKLDSQPKSVSRKQGMSVVACINHVMVLEGNHKLSAIPAKFDPQCVDIHPGMSQVAVGGSDVFVVYQLSNGTLSEVKRISIPECTVNSVRYSPDGAILAVVGSNKRVMGYSVDTYEELFSSVAHAARVCDVDWSPDSSHLATCSIDSGIAVWIPVKSLQNRVATVKDAHQKSFANKIRWLDNNTFVSAGQDSNIKQWSVQF